MEPDGKEPFISQSFGGDSQKSFLDRAVGIWHNYKIPIILLSVSSFSIIIAFILFVKSYQSASPIEFSKDVLSVSSSSGVAKAETKGIIADIEGAVVSPGIYELPFGSRIDDLLQKAGGLRADADTVKIQQTINRAAKLSDGGKIYIPKKGESQAGQGQPVQGSAPKPQNNAIVSVNSASQADLEALPGIGPATAKKIISGRPYQTLEELVSKKALSQSLFNKLKDQMSL